jgi:hypothetical protein
VAAARIVAYLMDDSSPQKLVARVFMDVGNFHHIL